MNRVPAAGLAAVLMLGLAAGAAAQARRGGSARPARPTAAAPSAPAPAPAATADFKPVPADRLLVIDTNKGRILVELAPEAAPKSVEQVRGLAVEHFYDGLTFFRVIDEFMAQTGDPQNTGEGGSKRPDVPGEFTFRRGPQDFVTVTTPTGMEAGFFGVLPAYSQPSAMLDMTADGKVSAWGAYCPGVLGMARNTDPDSNNSQFFLMRRAYPSLEKRYTAFGRVVAGLDVVRAIKAGEPVPEPQDRMTRMRLAADLPEAERPRVSREDPSSAAFRAEVERVRAAKGADFSICDVEPRVRVG